MTAYLDYLQRGLGSRPDPRRAAELQSRLPLQIVIDGPGFDTPDLPPVHYRRHHGRYQVGHHAGRLYLRSQDGDYTITFRVQAKRQLLLAISHELRSPITRARLSTELLPETQKRAAISRDLATMSRLIDERLEGERLQHKHAPLQREPVVIDQLTTDLVGEFYAVDGLHIEHRGEQRPVQLDPARIRRGRPRTVAVPSDRKGAWRRVAHRQQ